jgi:hypothetical protein
MGIRARLLPAGLGVLLAASLAGCQDGETVELSATPAIRWDTIEPRTITALQDTLHFRLYYEDGDGDLGNADPAARNLFLTDQRLDITHAYRIQQLAPETENGLPITGKLSFSLANVIMSDSSANEEPAVFSVYVADRAGNSSDTLQSPSITVRRAEE